MDVTASHSLEQVSPEPGSLLFIQLFLGEQIYDWLIMLFTASIQFILGTCLPEIHGKISSEIDDSRADWNSSSIPEVEGLSSSDLWPSLEWLFCLLLFPGEWCQIFLPHIYTQSAPMCLHSTLLKGQQAFGWQKERAVHISFLLDKSKHDIWRTVFSCFQKVFLFFFFSFLL